jgi:hypothetical protein
MIATCLAHGVDSTKGTTLRQEFIIYGHSVSDKHEEVSSTFQTVQI